VTGDLPLKPQTHRALDGGLFTYNHRRGHRARIGAGRSLGPGSGREFAAEVAGSSETWPQRHLSHAVLQLALLQDARAGSISPVGVSEHAQLQLALLQLALSGSAAVLQLARLHEARV
jgi:hypothetical protein